MHALIRTDENGQLIWMGTGEEAAIQERFNEVKAEMENDTSASEECLMIVPVTAFHQG